MENSKNSYFKPDAIAKRKKDNPYFTPEYTASRHRYVKELRELAEQGPPEPQEDWDSIYVFSGPESSISDEPADAISYNQTRKRLETGIRIARAVTALRLGKRAEEVSLEDMTTMGPAVYFDGYEAHNIEMKRMLADDSFESEFSFPTEKFSIGQGTIHTGDQVTKLPSEPLKSSRKIVLVSDWYHIPRIERYIGSRFDIQNIPIEKVVLAFPSDARVSTRRAFGEAKRIHPYWKKGDLSKD